MKRNLLKKTIMMSFLVLAVSGIMLSSLFSLQFTKAKAEEIKFTESPVITILTHGACIYASSWTGGEGNDINANTESIIEQLYNKNNDMDIYQIKYDPEKKFKYESKRAHPGESDFLEINHSDIVFNPNRHLLLVYQEASNDDNPFIDKSFVALYNEFNEIFKSVIFQYHNKFGVFPRVNLIGHSLGGVLNLKLAVDYADFIDSMFSLGTLFDGSFLGEVADMIATLTNNHEWFKDKFGQAVSDILYGGMIQDSIMDKIRRKWNAEELGKKINTYAYIGQMDVKFLVKMCLQDEQGFIPENIYRLAGLVVDKLRPLISVGALTISAKTFILGTFIRLITGYEITDITENVVENLFNKIVGWSDGSPIITCDFLVTSHSQGGFGYNDINRIYRTYNQSTDVTKKSSDYMPAVPHNLEQQDPYIIKSIVSKINLGTHEIFNIRNVNEGCVVTGINQYNGFDSLDIPEYIEGTKVVGIDDYAFADNFYGNNIKTVNIPKTVKSIGNNAFYKCNLLETVNFASGSCLTSIGTAAFYESGIKSIIIPNTVTEICDYAFFDCDNLTSINLSSSLKTIGMGALGYNKLTQINATSNSDFVVDNGILYNGAKTEIVTMLGGSGISQFSMPNSIETVNAYAFAGSGLSQIDMSNSIHIIDWGAFENCKSLETIYLPSTLRDMRSDAFNGCENLNYVRFESEVVPDFGWGMFDCNAEGRKIYVPGLAKEDYLSNERLQAYNSDITTIVSKIYFNTNGGEEIEPMDAEYNKGIALPTPVRSGCEFLGWYFDEEFTDVFASSRWYEDSDTTLYAKWQILDYSINYYDSETNEPITDSGNAGFYDVTQTVTLLPVAKAGYTFAGWYDNRECSGEAIASLPNGDIEDKQLFAKWQLNEYTVNYYDTVTNTLISDSDNVGTYNITQTITLLPIEKAGYTFAGWYGNSDCSGEVVVSLPNGNLENKTLYARWELNEYTVHYYDTISNSLITNSGNAGSYDVEHSISLLPAVKAGYTFAGWYDNTACNGEAIASLPNAGLGNKTLYAKWELNEYSVNYHDSITNTLITNSGNAGSYDVEHTIVLSPIEKAGYTFMGWYDNSECVGEAIDSLPNGTIENKELFAKWGINEYSVNYYDAETNNFITNSGNVGTYNVANTITLLSAVKEGYTFAGWYDNRECIGNGIVSLPNGNLENKKLYAKFVANFYEVTLNLNGKDIPVGFATTKNVEYAKSYNLGVPVNEKYYFTGWEDENKVLRSDEDGSGSSWGIARNVTLYARWSPKKFALAVPRDNVKNYYTVNIGSSGALNTDTSSFDSNKIMESLNLSSIGYKEGYLLQEVNKNQWLSHNVSGNDNNVYSFSIYNNSIPQTTSLNDRKIINIELKWVKEAHILKVNDGGQEKTPITKYYGEPVVVERPTKVGYVLIGWNIDSRSDNLANTNYSVGTTLNANAFDTNMFSMIDLTPNKGKDGGIMHVTALWRPMAVTVNFETNGGADCQQIKVNYNGSVSLPASTKLGYSFSGWSLELGNASKLVSSNDFWDKFTPGSDNQTLTLFAVWSLKSYKFTYQPNNGDATYYAYYNVEQSTKNGIPLYGEQRLGYRFKGWLYNGTIGYYINLINILSTGGDTAANSVVLVAQWTPVTVGTPSSTAQNLDVDDMFLDFSSSPTNGHYDYYIKSTTKIITLYGTGKSFYDIRFIIQQRTTDLTIVMYNIKLSAPVGSNAIYAEDANSATLGKVNGKWCMTISGNTTLNIECIGINNEIRGGNRNSYDLADGADPSKYCSGIVVKNINVSTDYLYFEQTDSNAELQVYGGYGYLQGAVDGASGIWASYFTVEENITMTVFGGHGSSGSLGDYGSMGKAGESGHNNGYNGGTGGTGGRGGDGRYALNVSHQITVRNSAKLICVGGDGGKGGTGGTGGAGGTGREAGLFRSAGNGGNGGAGGTGGNGGTGYAAIMNAAEIIVSADSSLEKIAGKGGAAGDGGAGGRGGYGGVRLNGSVATMGSEGAKGNPGSAGSSNYGA